MGFVLQTYSQKGSLLKHFLWGICFVRVSQQAKHLFHHSYQRIIMHPCQYSRFATGLCEYHGFRHHHQQNTLCILTPCPCMTCRHSAIHHGFHHHHWRNACLLCNATGFAITTGETGAMLIKIVSNKKKSIMITNLERLKIVYNYKIIDANKCIYFKNRC